MAKNSKAKGSAFEREICKKLNKWWAPGVADQVFWRSVSSGGRATVSGNVDQYGDICAIHPLGFDFTKKVIIEAKKGYGTWSPFDCIDGLSGVWDKFITQVERDKAASNRPYFWLIFQRPRRKPVLVTSVSFYKKYYSEKFQKAKTKCIIRSQGRRLVAMTFDDFLSTCPSRNMRD